MKYTDEQIKHFAAQNVQELMDEPKLDTSNLLNIEVIYHLNGDAEIYSKAIRDSNPNSRLFKATYEDELPIRLLKTQGGYYEASFNRSD